jgi:hypothetical protein
MADPRAFVSFDFDNDERWRNLFVGQARKDSPTPFVVADWSSKAELPQSQWEALIAAKIAQCNLVVVLVGRHVATATGVAKEIQFAKAADVPFLGVYVDGANLYSSLPVGLARNRVIAWTWAGVGAAIDQMMTEGKNR